MSSAQANNAFPNIGLPHIPGFRLEQELGRGGMGVVYRAVDVELERSVAVKLVRIEHSGHAESAARFLEEARITGRLQHPGVPPVHRLGFQTDGRPFLAMKLIDGRTLADLLWDRATPASDLPRYLQVFEQVCQTVGYAHEQGVIHRDLKPSNVMVGAFGEVQVMDWGLAKVLALASPHRPVGESVHRTSPADTGDSPVGATEGGTQEGQAVGTPAYMSPEQARGEVDRLDARTDVFALGAMLCEILTGQPPFGGPYAIVAARSADLVEANARLDACGADAELVSLARHCLAPAPEDRPANAGGVAERMTAYRLGVEQRLRQAEQERAAAEARAVEQRKRQRVQRWLTLAVVLMLVGVGGVAWYADRQVREQAFRSSNARVALGAALDQTEKSLRADRPEEAEIALAEAQRRLEADGHADPDGSLARRLADLQGQLAFLVELDGIRDRLWTLSRGNPNIRQAMGQQFADAFRERGFDLGRSEEMRDRLSDWAIRAQVLGALDMWLYVERRQQPVLVAVLAVLDPDADRNAWRAAVANQNLQEQVEVAERLKETTQPSRFAAAYSLKWPRKAGLQLLRSSWNHQRNELSTAFALALVLGTGDRPAPEELEEAAGYYRVCLGLRPRHAPSLMNLGNVLSMRKNLDGAINAYREAIAIAPADASALYNLGGALQSARDLEGAIRAYRKAIGINPRYFNAHYNLGNALKANNDLDGAITAYREAIAIDPEHASPWNNLGLALKAKGDLEGAIAAFRKAIQLDSKVVAAHRNLGDGLKAKEDFDGAIDAYRKAIAIDPTDDEVFFLLGEALMANEEVDGAIDAYRKATAINPKFTEAFTNLGIALVEKKDPKGAIAAFRDAVACDPSSATAHYNLGNALKASGDLIGAIGAFRKATDIDPKFASAFNNLGVTLKANNEIEAAIEAYHKSLAIEPKDASVYINLGNALEARKDLPAAIEAYRKGIAIDPNFDWAYNNLGNALNRVGDQKGAAQVFRQAIAVNPQYALAHNNLGLTLAAMNELDAAIEAHRKAIAIDPRYAGAYADLGVAQHRKGNPVEAIEAYREAIAINPTFATAHYNLGQCLCDLGRFAEAVVALRHAHELGSRQPNWNIASGPRVREVERLLDLDNRLPRLLEGAEDPDSAGELVEFAGLCFTYRERFSEALGLYAQAFRLEPTLETGPGLGHRYNAVCAALRAAEGAGVLPPAEKDRPALRQQALAWIRAELEGCRVAQLASLPRHMLTDPDLASVRDRAALDRLPQEERQAWQEFWADLRRTVEAIEKPGQ